MNHAKVDALGYLLTLLIQRVETEKPGLIKEMVSGVKADRLASVGSVPDAGHIDQIFDQALKLLDRADA